MASTTEDLDLPCATLEAPISEPCPLLSSSIAGVHDEGDVDGFTEADSPEPVYPPTASQETDSSSGDPEPDENAPCATDAGHSRFIRKPPPKPHVYCPCCDKSFSGTLDGLEEHFSRNHLWTQSCTYCSKPVYEYVKYVNERKKKEFYHKCNHGPGKDSDMNRNEDYPDRNC